jgi:CHASE2 domain-containing sensor protein
MNPKITRRQLAAVINVAAAGAAAISLDVVKAAAQTPAAGQDLGNAARESHRRNSATLAQFEIQMSLEPAFLFKA